MDFGSKLKQMRTKLGLSQEQFAESLGVTRQTIASWEKGKTYPDIGSVLKLSDLYEVSLDELLKEDSHMKEHVKDAAEFTGKLWNSLFVAAVLLLPSSMLLTHWGWGAAGEMAKLLGMVLLLLVLVCRWKLSNGKKSELAIGLFFWLVFFVPDLIGLFVPREEVVSGFTFEYILFGIFLLYSYGVCFQTRLAFLLVTGLYFGVPIFVAVSAHLPTIMEYGITQKQNIWGKDYRVEAVLYQDETVEPPSKITLDGDGKTLIIDHTAIGQFTKMESGSGDPMQTWKLIPTNDPVGRVILSASKASEDAITLEYRIDNSTAEYSRYSTLWSVKLSPVDKISFQITQEDSQHSVLLKWYSEKLIPERMESLFPFTIDEPGTGAILLDDDAVTQLTVWEEYHCDSQIEIFEHQLHRDKKGVFPLPEGLKKRYEKGQQYVIYRISWQDGEFLFRLNYEEG